MNIEEMKAAWKTYDDHVRVSTQLSHHVVVRMITDCTDNRLSSVKKKNIVSLTWMLLCLSLALVIMFTNPLDYAMTIQYIPLAIFIVCDLVFIAGLCADLFRLQSVTIQQQSIEAALKEIIILYERPRKFLRYTLFTFLFSQVFLFPLSFLPKNIESMGLWTALGERLIPIGISLTLLFIAYRLGAFKDSNPAKFKSDLDELNALKEMSAELHAEK